MIKLLLLNLKKNVSPLSSDLPAFNVPTSTPIKEESNLKHTVNTESRFPGSWISRLVEDQEQGTAQLKGCEPNIGRLSDSLPKLKLDTFDGDPLQWPDWMSMFQSIIHEASISPNAKMQHLQNSVSGKAKEAIEGFGYSGTLYVSALGKLESRFGKPDVVVKSHLNRLRRWNRLSDDRLQEVRHFSDALSSAVNNFQRLGYVDDLCAANNLNMVVDKLPPSLTIKWKEHVRDKNLFKSNLMDFCKWIDIQADIYDEFNLRSQKVQHSRNDLLLVKNTALMSLCHINLLLNLGTLFQLPLNTPLASWEMRDLTTSVCGRQIKES